MNQANLNQLTRLEVKEIYKQLFCVFMHNIYQGLTCCLKVFIQVTIPTDAIPGFYQMLEAE